MSITFDFIAGEDFRATLQSDYRELLASLDSGSFKAAAVLAGSITEAILLDYLVATDYGVRSSTDPLKLTFSELVDACKAERIITARTADLCSVVRSYRNLIHPGRSLRLQDSVDEASASVAKDLVRIVASEVAKTRRASYGLTAEQLVSKIERDSSTPSILSHLLPELSTFEKDRLLLTVLPGRYFELPRTPTELPWETFEEDALLDRLSHCFRRVFEASQPDTQKRVAQAYVAIIKQGSEDRVKQHGEAFFRASDLDHLPGNEAAMVRGHLLGRMNEGLDSTVFTMIKGIEKSLLAKEAVRWLDPLMKATTSPSTSDRLRQEYIAYIVAAYALMAEATQSAVLQRFDAWLQHYKSNDQADNLGIAEKLRSRLLDALL